MYGTELSLTRRGLGCMALALGATASHNAAAADDWHCLDLTGTAEPLHFTMTRASDGKLVTEADYRGKVTLLYFGYTFCPDQCPTTMSNMAEVLQRMGAPAEHVRVLFTTVDPDRDTLTVLRQYASAFGPGIDGLRGTPDALATLAKRYRIAYSVVPASADQPYEVTHSSALFAFDATGAARLMIPSMDSTTPDFDGTTADLKRLVQDGGARGIFSKLFDAALHLL